MLLEDRVSLSLVGWRVVAVWGGGDMKGPLGEVALDLGAVTRNFPWRVHLPEQFSDQ